MEKRYKVEQCKELKCWIVFEVRSNNLLWEVYRAGLKRDCQHHRSKASILRHPVLFIVELSHPYMTTGRIIALTRQTSVGKVMSLLFNMLSKLVIAFLPWSKYLLISWLQSPSAVILEHPQNKVCHCFHCFPICLP